MKARQKGLPCGKRMPVSPITEINVDEGLSHEMPGGASVEMKAEEEATGVVNCGAGEEESRRRREKGNDQKRDRRAHEEGKRGARGDRLSLSQLV